MGGVAVGLINHRPKLYRSATNQEQLLGCQIVKNPFGWGKSSCAAERLDPLVNKTMTSTVNSTAAVSLHRGRLPGLIH